jgi:hypothetical protein
MAESEKCVECGRPLEMSLGMTINGDTYHTHCWDERGTPLPKARSATSLTESGTRPDLARPRDGLHTAR